MNTRKVVHPSFEKKVKNIKCNNPQGATADVRGLKLTGKVHCVEIVSFVIRALSTLPLHLSPIVILQRLMSE